MVRTIWPVPFPILGPLLGILALLLALGSAAAQDVEIVETPGGLTAWLVSDNTVPIVTLRFSFRSGASHDPAGTEGTAELLTTLFDEGAGDYDSRAFQRRLQTLSMGIGFDAGRDGLSGSMRTLSAYRDEAFEMLRLAVNEPNFAPEAIERMRTQLIVNVRSRATDPDYKASRAMGTLLFPDHPYGRTQAGTPETLAAITREDIIEAHRRIFTRDTLTIAAVGDITAEELAPLLDSVFGALPAGSEAEPIPGADPRFGELAAIDVDAPQTLIRVATQGVKLDDPDILPAIIMNHILGGGQFSSRLYTEVREKRGLVYGIGTGLLPMDHAALLMGSTSTQPQNAAETLRLFLEEMARMAEEGPTQQEVDAAIAYQTGSYALRFDTSGSVAHQLLSIQEDDLGPDYFANRNDLVRAITLEDVRRVARRTLGAAEPSIVVVGPNASDLIAELENAD